MFKKLIFTLLCSTLILSCAGKHINSDVFNAGINKKPKEHSLVNVFNNDEFFKSDLNTLSNTDNNVILCGQIQKDKKADIKLGCSSHHLSFECDIDGDEAEECIEKFKNAFNTESKYY